MTGWNMPPGCNPSDIPGNGPDGPCDACGRDPAECICPECPECTSQGDPRCYLPDDEGGHGLCYSIDQVEGQLAETRRRAKFGWHAGDLVRKR